MKDKRTKAQLLEELEKLQANFKGMHESYLEVTRSSDKQVKEMKRDLQEARLIALLNKALGIALRQACGSIDSDQAKKEVEDLIATVKREMSMWEMAVVLGVTALPLMMGLFSKALDKK